MTGDTESTSALTPPCANDPATQAAQDIMDATSLDEEAEATKWSGDQMLFSEKHKEANELRARALSRLMPWRPRPREGLVNNG